MNDHYDYKSYQPYRPSTRRRYMFYIYILMFVILAAAFWFNRYALTTANKPVSKETPSNTGIIAGSKAPVSDADLYNVQAGEQVTPPVFLDVQSFDLMVSDVEMPGMTGFELTSKVRQREETKTMPVIICTSLATDEHKRLGMEVGAQAYIVKGNFDQGTLLDTVASLIA